MIDIWSQLAGTLMSREKGEAAKSFVGVSPLWPCICLSFGDITHKQSLLEN